MTSSKRPKRRIWRWLTVGFLLVILAAASIVGAGVLGFSRGVADRQKSDQLAVEERLAAARGYMASGQPELAATELARALQLDPENAEAQRYLPTVQSTAEPTPAVPPLILVPPNDSTPLPTLPAGALPTEVLLQQAKTALAARDWAGAVASLDELAALDSSFQTDEVNQLRFDAYLGQAETYVAAARYEEALRAYDQALGVHPNDVQLKTTRELVALYVEALGQWRLDWAGAIRTLQTIQARQPRFLDVAQRLPEAYEGWGDSLARAGQWCDAATRYTEAVTLAVSETRQSKLDLATQNCANPQTAGEDGTPQPGETVTPGAPVAAASGSGGLVFASFSTEQNRWNLFRLPLSGARQPQVIAEAASQAMLSPDGSFVAARSEQGDQTGLTVFSSNGADRRRLTTFFEDSHPSWSFDGSQLVFESNREGDRTWRIYRVSAAGGDDTMIGVGRWPAWSPRGQTIVYQGCIPSNGRCGLLLVNPDGSNIRQATDVPGDAMPAWSPDGARIAFASADRGNSWDLYVLELASGNVATLAASPGLDVHPTWSPDGRQVAYLSNRDGAWALYIVDVASGQSQKVVAVPGSLPDWYEAQVDWGRAVR